MAEFLEIHHFEPFVGKKVKFKDTRFEMTLDRIVKGQKFIPTAKRDPFILIFRAPKEDVYMTEGMYACEFEGGPTYEIYVLPTHTLEREWQDYQAIFN